MLEDGNRGVDLSDMRIHFQVVQDDTQTPNHASIRIYNLSQETAQQVQDEFKVVTLSAGYSQGQFGIIFRGDIKMVRRGRSSPVDTHLDILAADGDLGYNYGFINQALAAGYTAQVQIEALRKAMGAAPGFLPDNIPPGAASRGKVMFGLARDRMRELANSLNATWSIQNGKLQIVPRTGYIPGTAVVLNSRTGLLGRPVQTEGGIYAKCFINPTIKIGCLVQIDNASIQRAFIGGNILRGTRDQVETQAALTLPRISEDGYYRVFVADWTGDTRGDEWFAELTLLAVNLTAPSGRAVTAYPTR